MYINVSPTSKLALQAVLDSRGGMVGLLQRYLPIHTDVHLDSVTAAYPPRTEVVR